MSITPWRYYSPSPSKMYSRITAEKALEVRRSLKLAAGMFLSVKDHLLPKLPASPEKGVDTDTCVVEAYAQMSLAEAHEVTLLAKALDWALDWALKLKLDRTLKPNIKPDVVNHHLALETSSLFTMAGKLIGYTTKEIP